MVDVSVVICTYNRAESLRDTLESLMNQNGGVSFEVLVVDNNSKDHTKQVVSEYGSNGVSEKDQVSEYRGNGVTENEVSGYRGVGVSEKMPFSPLLRYSDTPIRYIFEPRQGISYARNTGIRNASGTVVAFTDDDVVADPHWVEAIWKCFQETEAQAIGGRIERLWHCEKPEWFSEAIGGSLIRQDFGPERTPWQWPSRHMVGANIAFRKEVFEQIGYFREDLGRCGESLIGGEDREIFQRLVKKSYVIYYEPKAVVAHKVEKDRLTQSFMHRWFWHIGETLGHGMEWQWYHALTVAPVWVWKEMSASLFRKKSSAAEKFAGRMWVRHHAAMLKERFAHWLPFGWGRRWCAFTKIRNPNVEIRNKK